MRVSVKQEKGMLLSFLGMSLVFGSWSLGSSELKKIEFGQSDQKI